MGVGDYAKRLILTAAQGGGCCYHPILQMCLAKLCNLFTTPEHDGKSKALAKGYFNISIIADEAEVAGRPRSHPPAPLLQAPSTSRRGLIRVTTQRAWPATPLRSPQPAPWHQSCLQPPANATAPPLRWGPLRQVLSFPGSCVYGVGWSSCCPHWHWPLAAALLEPAGRW